MQWERRPVEIANLINPAFCSVLLRDAAHEFAQSAQKGIDFALLFLVLPLVLHQKTREILPSKKQIQFIDWVNRNQQILLMFPMHTKQMVPYTQEAIIFGLRHGILTTNSATDEYGTRKPDDGTNEQGAIYSTSLKLEDVNEWSKDSDPNVCRAKAQLVGHWFAETGDTSTLYRVLRIRP